MIGNAALYLVERQIAVACLIRKEGDPCTQPVPAFSPIAAAYLKISKAGKCIIRYRHYRPLVAVIKAQPHVVIGHKGRIGGAKQERGIIVLGKMDALRIRR